MRKYLIHIFSPAPKQHWWRIVSEHIHEWSLEQEIIPSDLPIPVARYFAFCGCGEEIDYDEILRRLNATSRLSAEDVTELRNVAFGVALYDGEASKEILHAIKAAEAYAAALEGEDVAP